MATPSIDNDELERAFDEDFAAWDVVENVADNAPTSQNDCNTSNCEDKEINSKMTLDAYKEAQTRRASASLLSLPREILLRVLALVPATGLTSCACACKALASLASDDALWRRLYNARWGKPSQRARADPHGKRAYLDADAEEWQATRQRDDGDGGCGYDSGSRASGGGGGGGAPGLAALFLDMLRAKRDTAPDRRDLDIPLSSDPGDIAAKVAAWRRARGFPAFSAAGTGSDPSGPPPPPRPDLRRVGLTFSRVNPGQLPPVYACDQNGWVHVCGEACGEGVVDPRSELLVCPVSGQTTDRLVHECEEEGGEEEEEGGGRGGRCGPGEEEAGLGVFGGGFGSFFAAGYACEDERALNRLLGYKAL